MRKRVILLGLTLGIIGAAFLVYYLSTRHLSEMVESSEPADAVSSPETGEPVAIVNVATVPGENLPGEVGIGKAEKFHYVHREKGRILREFGFERRLGSEEKHLLLSKPWVKFHTSEHRVIHICARQGRIPMESPGGQIQLPQSGFLEGEVRVAVYESPSAETPADPELTAEMMKNAQLLVEMEQVEFEREFSRLQSGAAVTVRSPYFQADGRHLSLQYDQVHETLQELQLAQMDQLRVRSRLLRSSSQKSGEQNRPKRSAPASDPDKKSALTAYRLVLQDEVVIEQPGEKLTADRMEVVTAFDYRDWMEESKNGPKEAANEKEKMDLSAGIAAQAEETEETVIRCEGGLAIFQTEAPAELDAGQIQLNATGNPVRVYRNGEVMVEAVRLTYNSRSDKIAMTGSDSQMVRVALAPQQWATAKQQVELDQVSGLATLTGPGQIEYRNETDQNVSIDYQDQLLVKSEGRPSLDNLDRTPPVLQRLEFTGHLAARTDGQHIQADKGILTFFPPPATKEDSPKTGDSPVSSIRSIDLQGRVSAAGPDRCFSADSLSATFTRSPKGGSVLEHFLAQQNVEVDDPEYRIEASESLDLKFDSTQDAAGETTSKSGETRGLGLEQLVTSVPLRYARATGPGGTVSLTDKNNGYEIQGDRVEGDASGNQWTIVGSPAVIRMARQGAIEGSQITINQKTGLCEVAGKGAADFLSEADLTGQKREHPIPVRIAWNDGAVYEINGRRIHFRDVTVEVEQKNAEAVEKSRLYCPELIAVLSSRETEKPAQAQNPFGGSDLASLEAAGPLVELTHEQYDAGGQTLQSLLNMQSAHMLFDNTRRILYAEGEGWIEFKQFADESTAARGSLPQSLGSFMNPQGASYSLLRFGRQMTLNQKDNTLFFDGPVALDHLPAAPAVARDATGTAMAEGLRRLDCQQLLIAADGLLGPKRQTDSSETTDIQELLSLASLSGQQPAEPLTMPAASISSARGGVIFEAVQNQKRYMVSGRTWVYDSARQHAVIQGDGSLPVTMTASESLPVNLMQCREIHLQIKPEGISFKAFPLK